MAALFKGSTVSNRKSFELIFTNMFFVLKGKVVQAKQRPQKSSCDTLLLSPTFPSKKKLSGKKTPAIV